MIDRFDGMSHQPELLLGRSQFHKLLGMRVLLLICSMDILSDNYYCSCVTTFQSKENVKKTKKKDAKKQAVGKSRGPKLRTARHSEL